MINLQNSGLNKGSELKTEPDSNSNFALENCVFVTSLSLSFLNLNYFGQSMVPHKNMTPYLYGYWPYQQLKNRDIFI